MSSITSIADEARIGIDTIADRTANLFSPTLRLGVTGLSRAGKTVFISALVHNLLKSGNLPMFEARRSGQITGAELTHQADDNVPRFQYEDHIRALTQDRIWPHSTRSISELRLEISYKPRSFFGQMFSSGKLTLDIIDYPGEWLLDLPLLGKSYQQFSQEAFALGQEVGRINVFEDFSRYAHEQEPNGSFEEETAQKLASLFTDYLKACKVDARALSTLPPGRFLMPGDLDGSPALTFSPLPDLDKGHFVADSLASTMERRFEAYKTHVIKPFFRQHVARLDRQIVLVDAMPAINAGAGAVADLERAISEILSCFRPGTNSLLSGWFRRRIDKVLVAATKADHLHHTSHDRMQAIVRNITQSAINRANISGANISTLALSAVRATREGTLDHEGQDLPVIIGTPLAGESIAGQIFDGETETAVFPGDLPANPDSLITSIAAQGSNIDDLVRFVRFRPPHADPNSGSSALPHIRFDRALEFLLGDQFS